METTNEVPLKEYVGRDLMTHIAFQKEEDGELDDMHPFIETGDDNKIKILVTRGSFNVGDVLECDRIGEDVYEQRWSLDTASSVLSKITCPQSHLHALPHMMPGPYCEICSGTGFVNVKIGTIFEATRLCCSHGCDEEHDQCKDHCSENDYGAHVPRSWSVDENDTDDKNVVLSCECACGREGKLSIDIRHHEDVEWDDD